MSYNHCNLWLVFSTLTWPFVRATRGIVGWVWIYMQKVELRHWWEYGDEKTGINQLNEKRSLIPWGLRVPIWNINSCSSVLRLSELPRCKERPQTVICCLEWSKCSFLVFFSYLAQDRFFLQNTCQDCRMMCIIRD